MDRKVVLLRMDGYFLLKWTSFLFHVGRFSWTWMVRILLRLFPCDFYLEASAAYLLCRFNILAI